MLSEVNLTIGFLLDLYWGSGEIRVPDIILARKVSLAMNGQKRKAGTGGRGTAELGNFRILQEQCSEGVRLGSLNPLFPAAQQPLLSKEKCLGAKT